MSESVQNEIEDLKKHARTEAEFLDQVEYKISSSLESLSDYTPEEWKKEEYDNLAVGLTALTEVVIKLKKALLPAKEWNHNGE